MPDIWTRGKPWKGDFIEQHVQREEGKAKKEKSKKMKKEKKDTRRAGLSISEDVLGAYYGDAPIDVIAEAFKQLDASEQYRRWAPLQDADVREQMRVLSWELVPAPPDGNCFSHALRQQLAEQHHEAARRSSQELREDVCSHLEEHWARLEEDFNFPGVPLESKAEYVAHMREVGNHATEIVVHAVADMFGRVHCIMPHSAASRPIVLMGRRTQNAPRLKFRFVFNGRDHYDGARPASPPSSHAGVLASSSGMAARGGASVVERVPAPLCTVASETPAATVLKQHTEAPH